MKETGPMEETAPERDTAQAGTGSAAGRAAEPLLELSGLEKHFPITSGLVFKRQAGRVHAVDGIDLTVHAGETLGLVGESGCGKSTTGRLVARLLEPTGGSIRYGGRDITHASRRELRPIRAEIQMIFQDPYSSLNPRHTVGGIIRGPMEINGIDPRAAGTGGSGSCWRSSGSTRSTTTASRTSSPAASASASASPARSPSTRG
nr:hypothetical protein GCM10020093_114450 [Planobispora longispora]